MSRKQQTTKRKRRNARQPVVPQMIGYCTVCQHPVWTNAPYWNTSKGVAHLHRKDGSQ